MFKFYESRSKLTVSVTSLKAMELYNWKGKGIGYTHMPNMKPISYSRIVTANVQKKVKSNGQGHMLYIYGTFRKSLS